MGSARPVRIPIFNSMRKKMNRLFSNRSRSVLAALMVTGAVAGISDAMAADTSGWYGDIGVGRSHSKIDGGAVDTVLGNQGLAPSSSADANKNAWKFDVGYQFHPNFAFELGYVDLGKAQWNSTITAPNADTLNGEIHTRGTTFDLVALAPLGEGFSVYGKAGVIRAAVDFSGGSNGTSVTSGSNTSTRATYGLGMGYDFTPHFGTKLEWDRYENLGDANTSGKGNLDLVTAALVLKF
jgi:OOP family OmpA-OmpF porin